VEAVSKGEKVPMDFQEAVAVTRTTFRILESARTGLPEDLSLES
jgi:hypothetical protein